MGISKPSLVLLLLGYCLLGASQSSAEVNVAASIRPLQLIAQAIVEDRGTVSTIVGIQDTPHQYSLTPSDRINLQRADLLLWISPEFEVQLADIFSSLGSSKTVITAAATSNVSTLTHANGELDPHLWLSSSNAIAIANQLSQQLQAIDVAHRAEYQNAFARFESDIKSLNSEIEQRLKDAPARNYIVFHNAYQYFEQDFDLAGGLVLVDNAEIQPSMRDILLFRNKLSGLAPACILLEPDSDLELVDTALNEQNVASEIVDLLGFEIEDGAIGYRQLMLSVADAFVACLNN